MVAGAAYQIMQPGALASEDKHAVPGQIESVIVGLASFVEPDDPDVLLLQLFKGTYEIDNTRNPEMLNGAGTGLHGYGTQWRRAPLSHDDSVYARSIGNAQQRAQVLRIFNTIEREEQARLR